MALRRFAVRAVSVLLLVGAAEPAAAAVHRFRGERRIRSVSTSAEGPGAVIVVTYGKGARRHVRVLHSPAPIDRVAIADIDNDGYADIVAAPRDGALLVWRNSGHGRFALAALAPHAVRPLRHGPGFARALRVDDGWQVGDNRHDAALARAPSATGDIPVSDLRPPDVRSSRAGSFRRFSGRAPPSAAS